MSRECRTDSLNLEKLDPISKSISFDTYSAAKPLLDAATELDN